jgi:hypothetical protein
VNEHRIGWLKGELKNTGDAKDVEKLKGQSAEESTTDWVGCWMFLIHCLCNLVYIDVAGRTNYLERWLML